MSKSDCGKGDTPRPRLVSDEEYELRWQLAFGEITKEEFGCRLKEIKDGGKRTPRKAG